MIHDLYVAEIMKNRRAVLEAAFEKNLIDLRRKFAIHPDHKKHYIGLRKVSMTIRKVM